MEITHARAVPVRAPGGALAGMAVFELSAPRAAGQAGALQPETRAELQASVDLGALVMRALPRRPAPPGPVAVNGSAAMRALLDEVALLARGEDPLLLRGARGVGKTWLAEWLVRQGHAPSPLERLHGAGLGAATLESALRASEGTVFVDDLDQLPPPTQTALLRWLEAGPWGPRPRSTAWCSVERWGWRWPAGWGPGRWRCRTWRRGATRSRPWRGHRDGGRTFGELTPAMNKEVQQREPGG